MARVRKPGSDLDLELDDLPAPARWREWMGRVEAAIFASAEPVKRENLARVVGKACNLDLIIEDIRGELRDRPYEVVNVAGGGAFEPNWGLAARSGPRSAGRKGANCRARTRSC
jgi:segregation and condensation protein B